MSGDATVDEGPTVMVCTRERTQMLGDCLRSVAAALPAGGEVIVVEPGSEAAPLVRQLGVAARHIATRLPGKSRQLNAGLRAAERAVVVITDDDCRVAPGWVEAMCAPFDDPRVGAVFGPVRGLSSLGGPQAAVPSGRAPELTWLYANGAAMAVRCRAAAEVGGFDERLGPGAPLHGEEHDLVLRMEEAGWTIEVAGASPVQHLDWRGAEETRRNLLVYSRGAGAFLGAALRRAPRRRARLVLRRVRYQLRLWHHHDGQPRWMGPATTVAFARGLVRGMLLRPRRFVEVDDVPRCGDDHDR